MVKKACGLNVTDKRQSHDQNCPVVELLELVFKVIV